MRKNGHGKKREHKNRSGRLGILLLSALVLFGGRRIWIAAVEKKAGIVWEEGREKLPVLFSWIFRHYYPAGAAGMEKEHKNQYNKEKKEEDIWWLEGLWRRFPLYRRSEEAEETALILGREDPAYEDYLDSRRFASEYEALLGWGGEDTQEGWPEGEEEERGTSEERFKGTEEITMAAGKESSQNGEEAGKSGKGAGTEGQKEGAGGGGGLIADNGNGNNGEAGSEGSSGQRIEEDTAIAAGSVTQPGRGQTYLREQLADYDFMMSRFFSVHASTTAGRDIMNAEVFLDKDFRLEKDENQPQILIYHTHSQETYADYGPENPDATVVGLGNYLTELLADRGYQVIHDTSAYDLKGGKLDRSKAYTYSLEGIKGILQKNPSIQVVLDIHRDGVKEGYHMVSQVNGRATAPIMFFDGMSRTPTGPIEYLPNPNLEDNLAFSFQMQLKAAEHFPGLTRKIYLKGLRYNLHLRSRSALIEAGAQTNTYEEARNAMEPLAEVLDMVLQGK